MRETLTKEEKATLLSEYINSDFSMSEFSRRKHHQISVWTKDSDALYELARMEGLETNDREQTIQLGMQLIKNKTETTIRKNRERYKRLFQTEYSRH